VALAVAVWAVQVVLAAVVLVAQLELVELQIQVAVAAGRMGLLAQLKVVMAVAVSSSSAIQTHLEPQQAQQVHQRLQQQVALGSTNSQPLVLLLFEIVLH
jgi:hypothetical protein